MTCVDSLAWAEGLRIRGARVVAAAQFEVFSLALAAGFLADTDVYSPIIKWVFRLLEVGEIATLLKNSIGKAIRES